MTQVIVKFNFACSKCSKYSADLKRINFEFSNAFFKIWVEIRQKSKIMKIA